MAGQKPFPPQTTATAMGEGAPKVAAVVLAAGSGVRMGGPKAWMTLGGRSLAEWCLDALEAATPEQTVMVVSPAMEDAARARLGHRCIVDVNTRTDLGKTGSLQTGLRRLQDTGHPNMLVVVHPVDHPFVEGATILRLLSALDIQKGRDLAVPTHQGRRGHPLILRTQTIPSILRLPASEPLNKWVRSCAERTLTLEVPDPAILLNLDTPEQLAEAEQWLDERGRVVGSLDTTPAPREGS